VTVVKPGHWKNRAEASVGISIRVFTVFATQHFFDSMEITLSNPYAFSIAEKSLPSVYFNVL
jgi:hypothetical protein